MLTNLDFIKEGAKWPPACEHERMELYYNNKELFEGNHAEVYEQQFKRIERVIGNFQDVISYPIIANFHKKISVKTADFLWIEPPKIKAKDVSAQVAIDKIIENSQLNNTGYENTIDLSRYGDGLLMVYKEGDHGMIDVTQPSIWYLVVDGSNIKRVTYHVLAWVTCEDDEKKTLTIQIHEKGRYTERVHQIISSASIHIIGDVIGKITSEKVVQTGLDDFAIVQVSNIITSDRIYGCDDYMDVDSIISEILVRVSQISRVLDKHAAPSMSGPQAALERDSITGEWRLKTGNYFSRDSKEDPEVQYVTWDGQLSASFQQIEKLVNFLAVISEMGSVLFDDANGTGNAATGTAIKLRFMSVLSKVKRISMRYTPALIKAIKLCSQLGGKDIINLNDEVISINWQDGLPNDDESAARIMQIRTGDKPTISQKSAIKVLDGAEDEAAEEELSIIQDDESMMNPTVPAPFANPPMTPNSTLGSMEV